MNSILENGLIINGFFPVGAMVETPWGWREVVGHEAVKPLVPADEPFGV